ncbi:hypothetical protein EDD85DRAFT_793501 [Armillaria nabsnona]|nr:hypothetical protein EDD85DRAFT_793501 [Armillaria nabsnona]
MKGREIRATWRDATTLAWTRRVTIRMVIGLTHQTIRRPWIRHRSIRTASQTAESKVADVNIDSKLFTFLGKLPRLVSSLLRKKDAYTENPNDAKKNLLKISSCLHQGVFKDHVVQWATTAALDADGPGQASVSAQKAEADHRFQAMTRQPSLRHSKKGISLISQWTSNEQISHKIHSMSHHVSIIRSHGSAGSYNTEASERLHIDASAEKGYVSQMTAWMRRREAVEKFQRYAIDAYGEQESEEEDGIDGRALTAVRTLAVRRLQPAASLSMTTNSSQFEYYGESIYSTM